MAVIFQIQGNCLLNGQTSEMDWADYHSDGLPNRYDPLYLFIKFIWLSISNI